jgi:hypothetical protein
MTYQAPKNDIILRMMMGMPRNIEVTWKTLSNVEKTTKVVKQHWDDTM